MLGALKCVGITAVAAGCVVIAGCGSDSASPENPVGAPQSNGSTAAEAAEAAEATAIDACALISAEDISRLLGVAVEATPTSTDPAAPGCMWENPANYESVSLDIGGPNTAVNGTLAPPEPGFPLVGTPGPDGMRFMGGGSVEFPAGGRANRVQVAVLSLLGEQANDAAVDLARKVGPQIPN